METRLKDFSSGDYAKGNPIKVAIWYIINYYVFNSAIPWPYVFKRQLLRLFGAKIGKGLIIKTKVRIKYPWNLQIGEDCWIGESVWIDNLVSVNIGKNVCLSQGVLLLTGNHDYTISTFPYRLGTIILENGVWIGANAVVCPGVICKTHSILTVSSVATKTIGEWGIYAGNPAVFIRERKMLS
jgi:putative colanic acid biosynthesis acetyltransferase WcaF